MKLNVKLICIILEIALIPLLLMGFVGYSSFKIEHTRQILAGLDAVAQIQKNRIQEELRDKKELFNFFVNGAALRSYVLEYNARPSAETLKKISSELTGATEGVGSIQKAFIADMAGVIFSATDNDLVGRSVSGEDFFR